MYRIKYLVGNYQETETDYAGLQVLIEYLILNGYKIARIEKID